MELETRLRDKESEVEQLRRALAKAGIKQEEVPVRFDGVGAPPHPPSQQCLHCMLGIRQKEVLVCIDGTGAPPHSPSQHCLHCAPPAQTSSHSSHPQTSSEHA